MGDKRVLKSMRLDEDLVAFIEWYGIKKRSAGFSHSLRMILDEAMSGMEGADRNSLAHYIRDARRVEKPVEPVDEQLRSCPSCGSNVGFAHYASLDWACQMCGSSGTTA